VRRMDDGDTWFHLAAGRLIAQTGRVPQTEPFSFSAAGVPWVNHEWLFDLGLYGAWRAGGATGASALAGAATLGGFLCLWLIASRRPPAWAAAALVALAVEAAVERFSIRPESVSFLFLGLTLLVLDGPMTRGKVVGLGLLQAVWANCHGLSILGFVPVGAA